MRQDGKIGIIGCGDIARKAYVPGARHYAASDLVAVASRDPDTARAFAAEHGIPRGCGIDELLADPAITLVANLTPPDAHAGLCRAILEAGKHVYVEKPLALSRAQAEPVLDLARARDLRIACAPDTFLGTGLQTCRRVLDADDIGTVVGGVAHFACPGHERWHPNPAFYYAPGGGPLFDMGPYYITALVSLLGPVQSVCGFAVRGDRERTVAAGPRAGERLRVAVDTHIAGVLRFASGAVIDLMVSFETWGHHLPLLELYGSTGSLALPDPNTFAPPVRIKQGADDWRELPCDHETGCRGAGIADLLSALGSGRSHRASAEMAFHVLDVMESLITAAHEQRVITIGSVCQRPAPVPLGLEPGTFD
ncbi:MAG: Gfo/Idh/MocA family protein [Planctomycetota bacterium]